MPGQPESLGGTVARWLLARSSVRAEKKRVLVIAPDDFTWRHLQAVPEPWRYEFIPVFEHDDISSNRPRLFDEMLEEIEKVISAAPAVDGIVAFWDFPATSLAALVAERHGLPGPTLESTLKCEHKYWSRLLQREVVPEVVPAFERVDPFDAAAVAKGKTKYPFWLKPIKSAGSMLGFRIENDQDLEWALEETRQRIHVYGDSFAQAVKHARLPEALVRFGTHYCIAERIISGDQVTLEGYVHRGQIHFHGAVDSIRQSNESTFSR